LEPVCFFMRPRTHYLPILISLIAALSNGQAMAEKRFWIVNGPERNCTIVETEPQPTQTAIEKLGKTSYHTREEAEADLDRVCQRR
jgi:hypothetical protein